jgi:hypothetical protein
MTTTSKSEAIEEVLARLENSWEQVQSLPACRLLRLAILRELTRTIHTLRSEHMATHRPSTAEDYAQRENFLTSNFASLNVENLTLAEIYQQSHEAISSTGPTPSEVSLPSSVLETIGLTKFTRQDRRWELEMAQEAVRQSWEFWQFETSTEIREVENFARSFSEALWPKGVVLFVESDGFLKMSEKDPHLAYWRGRWILVLDPKLHPTEEDKLEKLGTDSSWTRLHPHSNILQDRLK